MDRSRTLLEDTFEYQKTPFIIEIEHKDMFINVKTEEARIVDRHGNPARTSNGKEWIRCECITANVQPDYPYDIEKEWPPDVDKKSSLLIPLEYPEKQGITRNSYEAVRKKDVEDVDIQQVAKDVINKLHQKYKNDETAELEFKPLE